MKEVAIGKFVFYVAVGLFFGSKVLYFKADRFIMNMFVLISYHIDAGIFLGIQIIFNRFRTIERGFFKDEYAI